MVYDMLAAGLALALLVFAFIGPWQPWPSTTATTPPA
jgi:hypothetical protein